MSISTIKDGFTLSSVCAASASLFTITSLILLMRQNVLPQCILASQPDDGTSQVAKPKKSITNGESQIRYQSKQGQQKGYFTSTTGDSTDTSIAEFINNGRRKSLIINQHEILSLYSISNDITTTEAEEDIPSMSRQCSAIGMNRTLTVSRFMK
ncbi:uncharacterized protein I303_102654 [Kwoniella dejecticola CBS 10117]|uniref:Uncharacterized protein n=1 Tax=Kwoniella dejecticola CBS 10117 TaxID=1296121 RepID=A0A1A6A9D2_9TREE|nr:uncharacterized protein I303_02669 [Kwoniella dejecticola CBS 10117]OBR86658.1 hypothetical protein I303_02669 [Kwoniella dejecticola CBS 10117]